jgi:hypothetical protein
VRREAAAGPPRPEVLVSGGPAPGAAPPGAEPADGRWLLGVVLALFAVAASVVLLRAAPPPVPGPPPDEVVAELRVVGQRISSTRTGTLVVPVEVVNRGAALVLDPPVVRAEPVLATPSATGATRVRAGARARFVVIAAPDCRLLQPGSLLTPVATVEVTARTAERSRDLVLDLAADPDVRAAVASVCRPPGEL